jgi:hypothetical protein
VQVYGDNARKKAAVSKWVKCACEGRESVTDEERSGWPATICQDLLESQDDILGHLITGDETRVYQCGGMMSRNIFGTFSR